MYSNDYNNLFFNNVFKMCFDSFWVYCPETSGNVHMLSFTVSVGNVVTN